MDRTDCTLRGSVDNDCSLQVHGYGGGGGGGNIPVLSDIKYRYIVHTLIAYALSFNSLRRE